MNIPHLLACLLLAAPAAAAPHTIVARAILLGKKSFSHTVRSDVGVQKEFVGPADGQTMIFNTFLNEKDGAFILEYQVDVKIKRADGIQSFHAESAVGLASGGRVRTVECGNWTLDLSLDAKSGGSPAAWSAAGPNYRIAGLTEKTGCRLIELPDAQGNVYYGTTIIGRPVVPSFAFMTLFTRPAGNASKLQYTFEDPLLRVRGDAALVLGKTTFAQERKLEFLLEGPAR